VAASVCLLAILQSAAQPSAPAAPYTVITRAGRQPLPVRLVSGQEMFALDDLARLFALTVREDALAGGLTVGVGTQTIVLLPQQPLASIGGRIVSLPAAPVREGRTWLVPVDFVSRALSVASAQRLELRKPSRLILSGDVRMPRIAARSEALGSVTRVTVDVAPPTPHTVTQDGTRILVRFDADALDVADLRATPNDTLRAIRPGDTPQVLVLEAGPRLASFRSSDQPSPAGSSRIVVDLVAQADTGAATAAPPQQPPTPETPPLLDLPSPGGLRTIVIDPGHGGDDTGAKGAQGGLEKSITLSVARRLKGTLEARLGVRVILTRDGDQNVALDQRAAVANNNKADLFVSLHVNASVRPALTGAEVFYLSLEGYSDEALRAARGGGEALPVVGGGSREIDIVPWALAQARYIDQSAALARMVEAALQDRLSMTPKPLQQAAFRVLVGANMPAVLVEMGFLTSPKQEQQLGTDEYQNLIVQALADAIARFRSGPPSATGATR
jgi:N-acetylmuramoyl-L-alanine amidase